jgi:hypothetical protein
MLLFFLHRATLPSRKSKKRPKGRKRSAAQRLPFCVGSPRQYRIEENSERTPQRPAD